MMSMLALLLYGLTMLSDIGIAQAVIRSARGDDPEYLDTAWTMQVVRGGILWAAASLLAWPAAQLFREPGLIWIVPVGAVSALVNGCGSTAIFTMRRQLRPGPLALLEISAQVAGSAVMIVGAWLGWGVVALVVGTLLSALVHTGGSFLLPGRRRHRLKIEPTAKQDILRFGRWIFASSAVTFGAARGDQVVLARLLGAASLGFYNIALALAEAPEAVGQRVVSGLFYPVFSRVHNQSPAKLAAIYYRMRLAFDGVVQTGLGVLYALAPLIIDLLYDARYAGAAPMLRVLAIRAALGLAAAPCETCLTAQGLSVYGFRRNLYVAIAVLVMMPIGYWWAGASGVLWAAALSRLMSFVALWPAARERGLLRLSREALVPVFVVMGYGVGTAFAWAIGS